MKSKLLSALLVSFLGFVFTPSLLADTSNTMQAPKPVENKVLDAMVGTWTGESNMMGTKMQDELNIRWALNHQFLILDLKTTDPKTSTSYEGMGVFGVDAKGKAKTWWFDSWGAEATSKGTGEFSENKLVMHDGNAMFKEVRSFEIKDNQMTMHAKGTMMWQGKNTPFDMTTVYTKK
jgi:hypothetical protein